MKKRFYSSLAVSNIVKHKSIYLPFMLAGAGCVMMFYLMLFLATSDYAASSDSLKAVLWLGCAVIAIFTAIFLFYTNSFLMKRRKNEIGLYNILGMEKRHIGRVLSLETLFSGLVSVFAGLLFGILFSALALMLLAKILRFNMGFVFTVSPVAIALTFALFGVIFALILIFNLLQIKLSKPIDLLSGSTVGEKEPKTKWLIAVIGVICLGIGYYLALTTESPIDTIGLFFIAVILVIIGTFCLFTACSIALLKLLKKNKKFYYKTNHFTSVSGMIYRMKQNAAGLASICILSTMVLVMLSATSSLFIGFDDALRTQFPRDVRVTALTCDYDNKKNIESKVLKAAEAQGVTPESLISYRYASHAMAHTGNTYGFLQKGGDMYFEQGGELVYFIPLEDYNGLTGRNVSLEADEALYYSENVVPGGNDAVLGGREYHIKEILDKRITEESFAQSYVSVSYFVLPDGKAITDMFEGVEGFEGLSLYLGFDVTVSDEKEILLVDSVNALLKADSVVTVPFNVQSAAGYKSSYLSVYGGLFFLGIFLGLLFTMATAMIIYYKQISEGYDDKKRFEIMQKVGMSREEVRKTISSQVVTVFFLPLCMAVIHLAFAFKMITKMLALLSLTNVTLFLICTLVTILIFALLYSVVYALTARAYYKIVK